MSLKTSKICIRCGVRGHTYKVCYGPITSFGIIAIGKKDSINVPLGCLYKDTFDYTCNGNHVPENKKYCIYKQKPTPDEPYFLLVERKDSISFIGLVQGVYSDDPDTRNSQLKQYVNTLTCEERYKLQNLSWNELWDIAGSSKKNKFNLEKKFNSIKDQILDLITTTNCQYKSANYLMPKGRLKFKETTRQGAIREFAEETGYQQDDIVLLDVQPFEEVFIGINGQTYKNVFYMAEIKPTAQIRVPLSDIKEQSKEVRNVGWFTLNESLEKVRNASKKRILYDAYNVYNLLPETIAQISPTTETISSISV